MVVVLPAPFGPRNPKMMPRGTVKVRSSTTVVDPNRFVNPSMETASPAMALPVT